MEASSAWTAERVIAAKLHIFLRLRAAVHLAAASISVRGDAIYTQGGTGNTINMTDGGKVISEGTIQNATVVEVKYTGPLS
jgi:hypothetical protein